MIDSLTSHVPPSLACVLEAATTCDAIAIGSQLDVGTTIAIVTRTTVGTCAALSQVGDHVWIATIGRGTMADAPAHSILEAPSWERARPYLLREPLALAAELPALRLVAVAQPDPLDAWLAIDATDSAAVERTIKTMLDSWRKPPTIELAGKLELERKGTQVSVRADALVPDDLVTIVSDTLRVVDGPAAPPASPFSCEPPSAAIVSCHDDTQYKVLSVASLLLELASVDSVPVTASGDIVGIRIVGQPAHLLRPGDVLLGVDAHRITDRRQLEDISAHANGLAALAVRRAGVDAVIVLSE